MKRILSTAAFVVPVLLAAPAVAGDYHNESTLRCAQCHIMHFSESPGHGGSWNYTAAFGSAGPYEYLLRSDVNSLCLSCHDGDGIAPDVYGSVNNGGGSTDVRLGGFLNEVGDGNEVNGHTLGSVLTAPGGLFANPDGLNCTDCHNQHGYAGYDPTGTTDGNNYRNLQGGGAFGFVQYNFDQIGTFDPTKDVFERSAAAYDEGDVDWGEPDTAQSAIATWCAACHGDFHGDVGTGPLAAGAPGVGGEVSTSGLGGWAHFQRHPSSAVNIGNLGGGHSSIDLYNGTEHSNAGLTKSSFVKIMSGTGVNWGANAIADDATPTCISCHKAHGNGNPYGLIFRQGMGTATENGDTNGNSLEDLCGQCHVQAEYFALTPGA